MKTVKKIVADYELLKKLGEGTFGEVFEARKDDKIYAMKRINKNNLSKDDQRRLSNEIRILKKVKHQNLVKLEDLQKTKNNYYLIYELCNGGDLEKFVEKFGYLKENTVRSMTKQIVDAYMTLLRDEIIHRDLKLANILLQFPKLKSKKGVDSILEKAYDKEEQKFIYEPVLKIADFGFARKLDCGENADTFIGTPYNLSPEIFKNEQYDFKSDVWSLGTVVYELLTGSPVFPSNTLEELKGKVLGTKMQVPEGIELTRDCLFFLDGCLRINADSRLGWNEIYKHPFLNPIRDKEPTLKVSMISGLKIAHFTEKHESYIQNDFKDSLLLIKETNLSNYMAQFKELQNVHHEMSIDKGPEYELDLDFE